MPERIVTNDDLALLGCDSEWIFQRTGIKERRWASDDQASSDLAYEAAKNCLQNAGVTGNEVDLILVATITQDYMTPSTACILQQKLGSIAPAMDLNAACSGFMYALVTGAQFVSSGMAKNVLIVGSEVMSRTVNPKDYKTYPLFGDGAGAVLLQSVATENSSIVKATSLDAEKQNRSTGIIPSGILGFTLGSEGSPEALCVPGGGSREPLTRIGLDQGRQYMQMDGRSVFKWAVRCVAESCRDVLASTGYSVEDVDLFLLHQANVRIIDAALSDFGIAPDRVLVNLDRFGNTSAASIPLVLDEANQAGRLQRGDLVMMCGFGAGLTWGTALVRW
ncbi:MAG: beta-ketoacyl-ACP synthase III [Pirellula sp.]